MKRAITIVIILALLGVAGYFAFQQYQQRQQAAVSSRFRRPTRRGSATRPPSSRPSSFRGLIGAATALPDKPEGWY
ncbi:MAG TPA: hypothetical protein VF498_18100, partial [Anaerolineales bacterium]